MAVFVDVRRYAEFEVFGFKPGEVPTREQINKVWREWTQYVHPDKMGAAFTPAMQCVNRFRDDALRTLQGINGRR